MDTKTLLAEWHVDAETGFRIRHVKSETERFRPHDHDYYEMFLVLKGKARHYVNNRYFPVEENCLIFVRKTDVHDYCDYQKTGLEFLNIAFTEQTFLETLRYLGKGFDADALLRPEFPPQIRLSRSSAEKLHMKIAELYTLPLDQPDLFRCRARALLIEILLNDFSDLSEENTDVPFWLENACEKMQYPSNFLQGKERFFALCGKTREHATRSLEKYYGLTPSAYLNQLRIAYAGNLLLSSNLSVTDVCFECGFGNVSHFYTCFKKTFGVTPMEYRENAKKAASSRSVPTA